VQSAKIVTDFLYQTSEVIFNPGTKQPKNFLVKQKANTTIILKSFIILSNF
jgi:hypothetical protein